MLLNGILGVYAACLIIPIFIMIYIRPYLRIKTPRMFINNFSLPLQLIGGITYVYFFNKEINTMSNAHRIFPLIPINIVCIEILSFLLSKILFMLKFRRKNK